MTQPICILKTLSQFTVLVWGNCFPNYFIPGMHTSYPCLQPFLSLRRITSPTPNPVPDHGQFCKKGPPHAVFLCRCLVEVSEISSCGWEEVLRKEMVIASMRHRSRDISANSSASLYSVSRISVKVIHVFTATAITLCLEDSFSFLTFHRAACESSKI